MVNSNRRFKTAGYEQFARIGKAAANPSRLELPDLLCRGPRTVATWAREAGLGLTNTSRQLKALRHHAFRQMAKDDNVHSSVRFDF